MSCEEDTVSHQPMHQPTPERAPMMVVPAPAPRFTPGDDAAFLRTRWILSLAGMGLGVMAFFLFRLGLERTFPLLLIIPGAWVAHATMSWLNARTPPRPVSDQLLRPKL